MICKTIMLNKRTNIYTLLGIVKVENLHISPFLSKFFHFIKAFNNSFHFSSETGFLSFTFANCPFLMG